MSPEEQLEALRRRLELVDEHMNTLEAYLSHLEEQVD